MLENIVESTESKIVADEVKKMGIEVWFLRPTKFANDNSSKIPVIRHALLESEKHFNKNFDIIVDLDVTSPLRKIEDIEKAIKQFKNSKANILISGSKSKKNPYFNMVELVNNNPQIIKKINNQPHRRQDAPTTYDMNASIYIWKKETILLSDKLFGSKTSLYIMPEERSIDIDTFLDFEIVENLLKKNHDE